MPVDTSPTPSATGQRANDLTTGPLPVPFPPPQTFDILPPLHNLILRLLSAPSAAGSAQAGAPAGAGASGSQAQPLPQSQSQTQANGSQQQQHTAGGAATSTPAQSQTQAQSAVSGPSTTTLPPALSHIPPLDPKDLITEASAIKIRIQKARAAVESLPDVQRSVAEQELEMRELAARIGQLRGVIGEFGRQGAAAVSDERNKMDMDGS